MTTLLPSDVLRHVTDVHCHPTDSAISPEALEALEITICAMGTRQTDHFLVADIARTHPEKVIPCFGHHPWFSHWVSLAPGAPLSKELHYRSLFLRSDSDSKSASPDAIQAFQEMLPSLPEPISIEDCISSLRLNFHTFPSAMLGEVGLDRSARVPYDYCAERRKLTPFNIPIEHQISILEAQLDLAVEMKRNISLHSVKSQKATIDLLERMKSKHRYKWSLISLDLHSCGFSAESWLSAEKRHANVFLSLSTEINGRSPAHKKLISVARPDRILVESDIHEIGQCTERTVSMIRMVADIKGWHVEQNWEEDISEDQWGAVRILERNWNRFVKGGHEAKSSSN